jgi:integrase
VATEEKQPEAEAATGEPAKEPPKKRGPRGIGTQRVRKDGLLQAWVPTGRKKPDGKPEKIPKSWPRGTPEKVAFDWRVQTAADIKRGIHVMPTRTTLADFTEQYHGLREADWKQAAARSMGKRAGYVLRHLGHMKLTDIRAFHFEKLGSLLLRDGLAPSTAKSAQLHLRRLLNAAVMHGLIARNPTVGVKPVKARQPEMERWDLATAQRAFAILREENNRYYAMWRLQLTGMARPGELSALHWDDVDLEGMRLYIRYNLSYKGREPILVEPKSESGEREIPLGSEDVAALLEHKARQDAERKNPKWREHGLVFCTRHGTPFHEGSLADMWREWRKKHPEFPPIRNYDLRGSGASIGAAAGIEADVLAKRLGHSNTQVTFRSYIRSYRPQREAAGRLMASLLESNQPQRVSSPDTHQNTLADFKQTAEGDSQNPGKARTRKLRPRRR